MATDDANWNPQTNWTISSGSLHTSLTFQSSLSFSDDDDQSTESLPLLLHSPSPDSSPCEITINFAEKHELKQIYVRSTARVYEIYYAPDLKSNNEYLCTVRCGVATRDGEILRSHGINLIDSLRDKDFCDESVRNDDDWVEVKAVDTPSLNSISTAQDLFEATAETNDVSPCISVTLRLLSLQSKGCVCVDEIYVFGDPVDSESLESHNENSSGSSLMAMFLPLMQLSKTTGLNAVRKEKQFVSEDDLKETPHPSGSVIENQLKGNDSITHPHEVELKEVKGGSVGPSKPETFSQAAKMESDPAAVPSQAAPMNIPCAVLSQVSINQGDFLGGNVERALEKLMSRMDKIEEICLGFQEKMVMPMNSIEARLERVEQQLETLSKKWQNSASAPDASCIKSETTSGENCLDCTVTEEIESDKKSLHTEVLNVSPRDMSDLEKTTQLLPGLVVTAPEFSEGEDEEDNASEQEMNLSEGEDEEDNASEPEMNPSNDKPKQSIDDALSSALANFLSYSLSSELPKYAKSLHVKAPEFSNEDDDHESDNEIVKNDSVHPTDSKKFSHIQDSSSNLLEKGEKLNDYNDISSEKTTQEAEQYDFFCSAQGDQDDGYVDSPLVEPSLRMDSKDKVEDNNDGKISGKESDFFLSNISNISNEVVDSLSPSGYRAMEAPKNTFHENIIENVLGFSLASPVVDFEIPLLDVKFISQTSPITEGYLESLLVETPETSSRDPSVNVSSEDLFIKEQLKDNHDLSIEEHFNLISVDDGEPVNPASNTHVALVEDLCSSVTAPVNVGGDTLAEDHKRKRES